MSKFNRVGTRPATSSPVKTETRPSGVTHEGAPGYARDAKSELFLLAVSNMVAEQTFYEKADERDDRYRQLVRQCAVEDPVWTFQMLRWLRSEGNMRSAALVGAAEFVHASLEAGGTQFPAYEVPGLADDRALNRAVVDAVLQRADEPGEMLGYWTSTYGRRIPQPVKRGVADAVRRLYNERSLLKYDTDSKGFRFGDVIDLVHPSPAADKPWQGDLFEHALDRRHGRAEDIPDSLEVLQAAQALTALPVDRRRAYVLDPDLVTAPGGLAGAGFTWERLAGWLQGPMDAAAWEAVIPSMGAFALVRNLRNFDQAGVSDEVAGQVAAMISDSEVIARSRMFPFRFLSAYNAAPSLRWAWPLEQALNHSLTNVPALKGWTLILVDRSGSMFGSVSEKSGLNRADTAAIFGTALAMRAQSADLVEFGTNHRPVAFKPGESLLTILKRYSSLGGTNTAAAVRANFSRHDRVVIVTDEQAWSGFHGANPLAQVPDQVPVYTWNLAGYEHGHGPSGEKQRHTFGGLTDAAFLMIPLLEAGRDAAWPWL